MDPDLLKTNALFNDLKFKQMAEKICDMRRKIEGDKLCFYSGEKLVMSALYYPLFERKKDGTFNPFIESVIEPKTDEDFNALISVLYQNHEFIDCIQTEDKQIYVGLNNLEMDFSEFGIEV